MIRTWEALSFVGTRTVLQARALRGTLGEEMLKCGRVAPPGSMGAASKALPAPPPPPSLIITGEERLQPRGIPDEPRRSHIRASCSAFGDDIKIHHGSALVTSCNVFGFTGNCHQLSN